MKKYEVQYDFTTVKNNGLFTGRSGSVVIESKNEISENEFHDEELIHLCKLAVLSVKPTWKIFMLKIKSATQINNL